MARLAAGDRFGGYEVLGPLGAGGMGEVYRGRDLKLGREVAIKLLPEDAEPAAMTRFRREAELLASLNHPGIATLYHLEEEGDAAAIVMELVPGESLAERLESGPLPPSEAIDVGRQVAAALEVAHAAGIAHRDLKPANVVVTAAGIAKVLDFGIASVFDASRQDAGEPVTEATALTVGGMMIGTAPYMSPEQVRAQPVDQRTDIWAFGCLLFELLTGDRAFGRETLGDTFAAVLEGAPDWDALPGDADPALLGLLQRCLAKIPDRRPATMTEVRVELAHTGTHPSIGGAGTVATLGGTLSATVAAVDRQRWLVLGMAAIAAAGLATLAWWTLAGSGGAAEMPGSFASVVVLPAVVTGPDDQAFLADAIPSALTMTLGAATGVQALMPPIQADVSGTGLAPREVAVRYGARAFVQPRVLIRDGDLVITLQLVDTATSEVGWSDEFRGATDDYVVVMAEAGTGLLSYLSPTDAQPLQVAPGALAARKQVAWERGRFHMIRYNERRDGADYAMAEEVFAQMVEEDPRDSRALSGMAQLDMIRMESGDLTALEDIRRWAERALAIDPDSAAAHAAMFNVLRYQPRPDYPAMVERILRAASSPNQAEFAEITMNGVSIAGGFCCAYLAADAAAEASRLQPLSAFPLFNRGVHLSLVSPTEAEAILGLLLELRPEMSAAHMAQGVISAGAGDIGEARAQRDWLAAGVASGRAQPLEVLIADHALALVEGRNGAARLMGEALRQQLATPPEMPFHFRYWSSFPASAALNAGDTEEFLSFVDAVAEFDTVFLFDVFNPASPEALADPRFLAARERARQHALWILDLFEEARPRGHLPAFLEPVIASERARLEAAELP